MHIDFFDFDKTRFEQIKKHAVEIFAADEAPVEKCPAESWCCSYCDYAHLCELNNTLEKDTSVGDDLAVTSDEDVINAVELLKESRELKKTGEELENEAKTVLDEKIRAQGIKSVKAGDLILNLSERVTNSFDKTAFKAAQPDMYLAFTTSTKSVVYKVKETD